jgi:hypothetical protein
MVKVCPVERGYVVEVWLERRQRLAVCLEEARGSFGRYRHSGDLPDSDPDLIQSVATRTF